METDIISVKYENAYIPKTFEGKAYSYYTNKALNIGDLVIVPTTYGEKIARVSETNISQEKIESIKPYMKTVKMKINRKKYLETSEILEEVA